jgi:hypothetical protein
MHGPNHGHPHHLACRCRNSCLQEGGLGLIDVFVLASFLG